MLFAHFYRLGEMGMIQFLFKDAVTSSISVNLVCILSTHPGTKMSPFSKYYNFTAMQPNSHLIAPSKRVNCDLQNEPGLKLIELIFKKL